MSVERLAARRAGAPTRPPAPKPIPRQKSLWQRIKAARWCYLFVLPNLVLAGMFTFYPAIASWWISLLQWNGFSSDQTFVGLDNYREIISDPYFWAAFRRSFFFMFVAVPIQLVISWFLAILLNNQALRLAPVFRTFFFIPVVTSAAIVGVVMTFVLSPVNGPVNQALLDAGLIDEPVNFLGNPDTAMWSVIGVYVWKWVGLSMVYWLAALQTVPQELYEAANVDGAGRWRTQVSVTFPLIAPFAAIIALISAINALNVFPLIQSMTAGGPFFSTEVMEIFIYRNAFGTEGTGASRLGYASAAGVWYGVCIMLVALVQGLAARRARSIGAELRRSRT